MDAWKKRKLTFCKSPFCVLAKDCSLPKYCACHGLELLKYWTCRFKRFVDRPRSLACVSKMDWSCHMLLFSVPQQHCRRGSSHPFFGHRLTNLFRSALFDDTFCLPSVSKAVSGVGVWVVAPVPFVLFCCVFSSGDLRVVAVWPGFVCVYLVLPWIAEPRCFTLCAFHLPASLIVGTEPQSKIDRNIGKKSIAAGGGGSALPAQKLSQEKMQDHMDWTRYTVHGSPQCQKLCGSSLLPFFVCSRFLFVFPWYASVVKPKSFIFFAYFFAASLTVRTEP